MGFDLSAQSPLVQGAVAYALTAAGKGGVRPVFDSGAVIAFGKRVIFFPAVRSLVKEIIENPFLKLLGRYVPLPVAALSAFGLQKTASNFISDSGSANPCEVPFSVSHDTDIKPVSDINEKAVATHSSVLFLIRNALKDSRIEIPYSHRVVETKQALPQAAS